MNDDERRRILRMVAEGTVTPEDGAELLDALHEDRRVSEPDRPEQNRETSQAIAAAPAATVSSGRSLVIRITEGEESTVNLRIPLGLARAAGRFLPRRAQHDLSEHGIDLSELFEGVAGGVDNGPLIMIQDDEDTVYIGVE